MILTRLSYNECTGGFTSTLSGKNIGYKDKDGYVVINIFDCEYRAHKLAMIILGRFKRELEVDHCNGVRDDNRESNLSSVTKKENAKNKRLRSNNKTGIHGVSWVKELSKWRVRISANGNKGFNVGVFSSFLDAACARKSAEIEYGYHINHGRCSA